MDILIKHKNSASINHWFNTFSSFKKRMIGFLLNAELVIGYAVHMHLWLKIETITIS